MKIIVDENMPYGREAFETLGDVETAPGRAITGETVRDAELLMVRSVTRVNANLLEGSEVRFVGTATIGEDHIDKEYLSQAGIGFSSAPGCNANSVGQYVAAALLEMAERYGVDLRGLSLGVVGVGNVGTRVVAKATALGMRCVLNDPPRERAEGGAEFQTLEEALACDVVTFHTPLNREGPDATYHLCDAAALERMTSGAVLINTSRGAVVDNKALLEALEAKRLRGAVLDVWEGEPDVNPKLLERCFLATPHIAGYSFDGKVNGTRQVYEAACRYLGVAAAWDPAPHLPPPDCPEVRLRGDDPEVFRAVREAVRQVYDIRKDDAGMRTLLGAPAERRGERFDRLRKQYPRRREFFNTHARVTPENTEMLSILLGLGFC
jgi:erythronate-4-phosphate dehydrogenase